MKPELLAPVGNQEHLQAAIAAGCDAVYFALQEFGARAFANNFSLEQAEQAIRQCHLMGVKVYIAMNTVLFEEEIEHAYQLAKTVTQMGADALIIQDIGLMSLIHHRLPDVAIHASTQVSVSRPSQIRQLKKLGVRRVILARECDKETVEKCKEEGLEIEIFIHGALCISMSGRCLLSSVQFGRSGNRGTCAQPCRMQYDLYKNGKKLETQGHYLLSPKDVSIIDQVNTVPVDSLKIEGRMKSVEYVYESVRQTRKVLDGSPRSDQDKTNLMMAFYRGYTKGHYYDQRGKDLISQTSCNHLGVAIGRVKEVNQQQIRIALDQTLYQQDGIRFANKTGIRVNYLYDVHGKLQNHIPAGQTAVLKRMDGIKKGDVVYRTASSSLEKQIEQQILHSDRKVKVHAALSCSQIGQPLSCRLDDGEHCVQVQSQQTAQPAQSQALNPQTLEKQMNKTGNSWVEFSSIEANIAPGLFFPLGAINQLRRDAIDALAKERTQTPKLCERPWKPAVFGHETKGIFETLPHCADQDWNITNSYAVIAALEMGYSHVLVSEECSDRQILQIGNNFYRQTSQAAPLIKRIYGRRRMMIMKHCPINTNLSDGQRKHCSLCHRDRYELVCDSFRLYCRGNQECMMELYEEKPVDRIAKIPMYQEQGIQAFFIDFLDETEQEKEKIRMRCKEAMAPFDFD